MVQSIGIRLPHFNAIIANKIIHATPHHFPLFLCVLALIIFYPGYSDIDACISTSVVKDFSMTPKPSCKCGKKWSDTNKLFFNSNKGKDCSIHIYFIIHWRYIYRMVQQEQPSDNPQQLNPSLHPPFMCTWSSNVSPSLQSPNVASMLRSLVPWQNSYKYK